MFAQGLAPGRSPQHDAWHGTRHPFRGGMRNSGLGVLLRCLADRAGLPFRERYPILQPSYTEAEMTTTSLTTIVSTKGQVILPKAIRDQLHWNAGTRLAVEHTADGVLLRTLTAVFAPTRPEDVFGCLSYTGTPKSVEQMDAGIVAETRRRHARRRY